MSINGNKPAIVHNHRRLIGGFLGLVVVAGAATAVVSFVATITRDQIAANQSARALQTVTEVLAQDAYNNSPDQDTQLFTDAALLGNSKPQAAYRARFDGIPAAVALTVTAPGGYIAPIELLVGIDDEGRVIAVRALRHIETPGLGDQIDIDKSDWIQQFNGRSLASGNRALALRRDGGDLDHISGATITSRAVSKAVRNALRYYEENRAEIFAPATSAKANATDR